MVTTEEWINGSLERIRKAMENNVADLDKAVETLYPLQREIVDRAEVRTVLISAASHRSRPSEKAVRLLGYLGCDEALPVFADALGRSDLRDTVLDVLPRLGGPEVLVGPLHALLDSVDAARRLNAINAAGVLGQAGGVASLLERGMADPDALVRSAAVERLGRLKCVEASAAIAALLGDPEEEVRCKAVAAFAMYDADLAMTALPRGLSDSSEAVRLETVRAMGSMRGDHASVHLLTSLTDRSPRVRAAVVHHQSRDQAAWISLRPMLCDPDFTVRLAVVEASAVAPAMTARWVIRKALTDARIDVREAAAGALHDRRGLFFVGLQRKALLDPSARVRRALVHESRFTDMWEYSPTDAVPLDLLTSRVLRRALRDSHPKVRRGAFQWLMGMRGRRVEALFGDVLRHGDRALRRQAVEALGEGRGPSFIPLLRVALRDSDPGIRRQADDCLRSLTEAYPLD
jgi:HEAT repeat protein